MTWQLAVMFVQYNVHGHFPCRGRSLGVPGTSREDSGPNLALTVSGGFLRASLSGSVHGKQSGASVAGWLGGFSRVMYTSGAPSTMPGMP